jgi:hypothetical protein
MPSPSDLRSRAASLRSALPERRQATPPPETGRRIGTITRSKDEEIRVNWAEYQGKPYVSLRMWNRSDDGSWWPDAKKGMSVRLRELAGVAEAIAAALDLAEEHQRGRQPGQAAQGEAARPPAGRSDGDGQRRIVGAQRPERRGYDPGTLPPANQGQFSEF